MNKSLLVCKQYILYFQVYLFVHESDVRDN